MGLRYEKLTDLEELPHLQEVFSSPIKADKLIISQGYNGNSSHFAFGTILEGRPGPFVTDERYCIDVAVPYGTEVFAARSGKVALTSYIKEWVEFYDGPDTVKGMLAKACYIMIEHDDIEYGLNGERTNKCISLYSHLDVDRKVIEIDEEIEEGQLIGYTGRSGWLPIPHMHFSVFIDNFNGVFKQSLPVRIREMSHHESYEDSYFFNHLGNKVGLINFLRDHAPEHFERIKKVVKWQMGA